MRRSLLWEIRGRWKQTPQKKLFSQWQKFLAHFSWYSRVWQTSRNILQGSTIYFYHCCIIYKSILLGPKRLLKARIFEKTKQHSIEEKILAYLFSFYRTPQTSRNILKRSRWFFDIYCANDKIAFLGLKRSIETNS